ncbi:MAG: hypothetical protein WCP10_01870 [Desulfuromonadales bacterium]
MVANLRSEHHIGVGIQYPAIMGVTSPKSNITAERFQHFEFTAVFTALVLIRPYAKYTKQAPGGSGQGVSDGFGERRDVVRSIAVHKNDLIIGIIQ